MDSTHNGFVKNFIIDPCAETTCDYYFFTDNIVVRPKSDFLTRATDTRIINLGLFTSADSTQELAFKEIRTLDVVNRVTDRIQTSPRVIRLNIISLLSYSTIISI